MADPTDDERVLRQRARATKLAAAGQRTGYALLGLAMVAFVTGIIIGLTDALTTAIAGCMALAALILAPAIILGYAAKAADREERTGRTGH